MLILRFGDMRYFLLLFIAFAFCACDNDSDDKALVQPNPKPSKSIANFTGIVEFAIDAPQIREVIERDLTTNPPFGGCNKYQLISSRAARYELYAINTENSKSADGYILNYVDKAEWNDNYRLFPAESGIIGWYKWDIVPANAEDDKPVATYDVFVKRSGVPASLIGSKWFFCEDLTEKYRQNFPNEDVRAVVRRLVLSYVSGGDIVNE